MLADRVIGIIFGIIEFLLAVRFVLQILGANAGAQFVAWLLSVSGSLVAPFEGAFPVISLGGSSQIDLSLVLAMIVYAILAWLIARLLAFLWSAL
jgi:hypothetical protein